MTQLVVNQNKFRFTYNPDVETLLKSFANIHEDEGRKQFKSSWLDFINENKTILDEEKKRLEQEGYKNDVYSKMFHTIKYYYVKKNKKNKDNRNTSLYDSPIKDKSRTYNKTDKDQLSLIVTFIKQDLQEYKNTNNIKPQYSYNRFLEKHSIENSKLQLQIKNSYKTQYYKIKNKSII